MLYEYEINLINVVMKKFYYLLLLALPFAFAACSDDDDLPDVDFSIDVSGAVNVDNALYVVKGDAFKIESIQVVNNDKDKKAIITSADYYWDYYHIGANFQSPYGFEIQTTEETRVGEHLLEIECPVYAVDKSPAIALVAYSVYVVENADDIPAGTQTTHFIVNPGINDKSNK